MKSITNADKEIGFRLRKRRNELRLSQKEVAESIGVTFQQLQKYEGATNRISAAKLLQLAKTLQTTTIYLLGENEQPLEYLTPTQRKLIDVYASLDRSQQILIDNIFDSLDKKKEG